MPAHHALYQDLAYVYGAALLGGLLARRLGQPLIIGYVLGGICVGPFTPGPRLASGQTLELFAEIGVILLMYSIGIEFSPRELLRVKWVALLGAPIGIACVIGMTVLWGSAFHWPFLESAIVGAAISVASTMVMLRFLTDRGELQTTHGRVMLGITLVEDLMVVLMTVLLPALAARGPLQGAILKTGMALILLVPVFIIANYAAPRVLKRVRRLGNAELYLLTSLGIGFITAAVTERLGLSLALGAFIAGMTLSGTEAAHDALERLEPLRDAFVALFFVTVGALIDPKAIMQNPSLVLTLIGLIVVAKFLVWSLTVLCFRFPLRTAVRVGVGFTQIGEFSYVLIKVGEGVQLVSAAMVQAVLAASLVTILLNAFLLRAADRVFKT